jgi:glycosyltransferase involved in cell wall biosynthesis
MKKVSIAITVYNQAHYISQAVESALAQDYPNLEVVVSDNHSTDAIELTMNKYLQDSRVKYFRNEKNIGMIANARKALYEYSSGELALHLDGDDYLIDKSYISKAVDLLERHQLVMVFSRIKAFYEQKNIFITDKVNSDLPQIIDGNWFFLNFYRGYSLATLTVLHDRHEAMKLGFFEKDIRSSDWEGFLRLAVNRKVGFINEVVAVWRRHGQNETMKQDFDRLISNIEYIESPYRYILTKEIFPKAVAEKWRKLMLKRYFARILVTAVIIKNRELEKKFRHYLRQYDISIYESLRMDIRFRVLMMMAKSHVLIRFVFKHVFGQESFIRDFEYMG